MAESKTKLPDGWTLVHEQEPSVVTTPGKDATTLVARPGNYVAARRAPGGGDGLIEQQGESMEQLVERINDWQGVQPNPNPNTEDGNRELSDEEKIESAKATAMQQITHNARAGGHVDLTPAPKKGKAKAAYVSAKPEVTSEIVEGPAAETAIRQGPQSTEG